MSFSKLRRELQIMLLIRVKARPVYRERKLKLLIHVLLPFLKSCSTHSTLLLQKVSLQKVFIKMKYSPICHITFYNLQFFFLPHTSRYTMQRRELVRAASKFCAANVNNRVTPCQLIAKPTENKRTKLNSQSCN